MITHFTLGLPPNNWAQRYRPETLGTPPYYPSLYHTITSTGQAVEVRGSLYDPSLAGTTIDTAKMPLLRAYVKRNLRPAPRNQG